MLNIRRGKIIQYAKSRLYVIQALASYKGPSQNESYFPISIYLGDKNQLLFKCLFKKI